MKKPLKAGDRVAMYEASLELHGAHGVIIQGPDTEGRLTVELDHRTRYAEKPSVYPQQLRRLIPARARRVWISEQNLRAVFSDHDGASQATVWGKRPEIPTVEFVEVKRKEGGK